MRRDVNFCEDIKTCLGKDLRVIFDVGANIGSVTTLLFWNFDSSEIFSFEPVKETYRDLILNTHKLDRVKCFNHGFSDRQADYEIFAALDSAWNSIEKNSDSGKGKIKISVDTIDQFCNSNNIDNIDVLKTDTEGHDLSVLYGARSMIKSEKIKAIYSEVGFYREDKGHTNFCDILYFLQENNFQIFNIYGVGSAYMADKLNPDFPWSNVLFIRNDIIRKVYGPGYYQWLKEIGIKYEEQGLL